MDLSYIVNKDLFSASKKLQHAGNDNPIEIAAGQEYVTARINSIGYSFFRLQLNFDETLSEGDVVVRMKDVNRGSSQQSAAGGMEVTLPMILANSLGTTLHIDKVLYTDGDIPLYNDDFFIKIRNDSESTIVLRNINIRFVR